MKYLIVDDSELALMLLERELRKFINEEDEIIKAYDGLEALEMYKQQNPIVCFTDLTMPKLNGLELTKEIIQYDKDAFVVVLSADPQKSIEQKATSNGALMFSNKPIPKEMIENIVKISQRKNK